MHGICEAIRHLSIEYRGQTLGRITISAGIANFPAHHDNLEDLINAADTALYKAKNGGRDCIVVFESQDTKAEKTPSSVEV